MPHIERTAEIVWEGNLARGGGWISGASSGAFSSLPYSNATRIGDPAGRTSPEELLAAAHGACFGNALAAELTVAGTPPGKLELSCTVAMDEVAGQGHQIVGSAITLVATVAGIDAAGLERLVAAADAGCPFSALLKRGGAEVTVAATLRAEDD
jgi:osmotically inducible protein OsmC